MPTFIDRHPAAAVPRAVRHQMYLEAVDGLVDTHGVQPLGHWLTDGVIYCVLQAPGAEAVCQHHADHGLPCDDGHPIAGLRGSHPLSVQEMQLVDAVQVEATSGAVLATRRTSHKLWRLPNVQAPARCQPAGIHARVHRHGGDRRPDIRRGHHTTNITRGAGLVPSTLV
jgi:hypothetical protein